MEEMPLDSLTAQMISWDATLVAVVVGLGVVLGNVLVLEKGATELAAPMEELRTNEADILHIGGQEESSRIW